MSDLIFSTRRNTILLPSGDQRGSLCTTASLESDVTWRGFRPALSAIQIRRPPAYVASNASRPPTGAHAGLNPSCTSRVSRPVSRSTCQISPPSLYSPLMSLGSSRPPLVLARTKTRCCPSGAHAGWMSSRDCWVILRSAPVDRVLTNRWRYLPDSATYARRVPSGDQAGHSSRPSLKVSCVSRRLSPDATDPLATAAHGIRRAA